VGRHVGPIVSQSSKVLHIIYSHLGQSRANSQRVSQIQPQRTHYYIYYLPALSRQSACRDGSGKETHANKRKERKGRWLAHPPRYSKSSHHITTHPPSFFFFPAIHCPSFVPCLTPSYAPESSPPFLFRLKKPSFFAFGVGGKAVLMIWLDRLL
jgi:hypothetical protein